MPARIGFKTHFKIGIKIFLKKTVVVLYILSSYVNRRTSFLKAIIKQYVLLCVLFNFLIKGFAV